MANKGKGQRCSSSGSDTSELTGDVRRRSWHFLRLLALSVVFLFAIALLVVFRNQPDRPVEQTAQQHGSLSPEVPTVNLPNTAIDISNEHLQAEAVTEVETLQSRFPDNPGAMHVAAKLFAGLQQTEKAEEIWRKCIALDSRYVGPRVGLANVLADRGQDEEAAEVLSAAIADRCDSPEAYHLLAKVLTKLGRLEEAERTLHDGISLYPQVPNLWFLLGQTQNQQQQFSEAETSLLKAIDLGYQSPTVYFALSNACVRQGKKDEAAEYRKRFSEMKAASAKETEDQPFHERYGGALRPIVASTLGDAAAVYAKENDHSEAERLFLRALALIPENTQILGELANQYLHAGRVADAMAAQERLVELEPENAYYRINLASVAAELGDAARAEKALNRAIELRPELALPRISLAQLALQTGKFERARSLAESSIRITPTVQAYGILAAASQALGDMATAKRATEMAQKLSPRNPVPQPPSSLN